VLISCITACGIYDLPAGGCRLASPDEIVPWETGAAVEPAAYMAQARSVVLLALALRRTA